MAIIQQAIWPAPRIPILVVVRNVNEIEILIFVGAPRYIVLLLIAADLKRGLVIREINESNWAKWKIIVIRINILFIFSQSVHKI